MHLNSITIIFPEGGHMQLMKTLITTSLLTMGLTAFAHTSANTSLQSVVITFAPGDSTIDSTAMNLLNMAVAKAKNNGGIRKIEIAVWSDKDHPIRGNLPLADRQLANARIKKIKSVLNPDIGRMQRITSYNMAENSSWLARTFETSEAQLDSAYAKRHPAAINREDFRIIKQEGAPSKAVVIIKENKR
jgi:hypothetical protein